MHVTGPEDKQPPVVGWCPPDALPLPGGRSVTCLTKDNFHAAVTIAPLNREIGVHGTCIAVAMCFETLAWHVVDRLEVTNHRDCPGRRQIPVVPESSTTCEGCIVRMPGNDDLAVDLLDNVGKSVQRREKTIGDLIATGAESDFVWERDDDFGIVLIDIDQTALCFALQGHLNQAEGLIHVGRGLLLSLNGLTQGRQGHGRH